MPYETEATVKPISSVQEGVALVKAFEGGPESFELAVPDSLLDPIGMNMAIIGDAILARGWWPDGFRQESGYRVYRYRSA